MLERYWRGALIPLLLFFVVGCVPYQTYQQTKMELERALSANDDLVKKYNKLLLLSEGTGGDALTDEQRARLAKLEAENESLQRQLQDLPQFTEDEWARFKSEGGEFEPGGGLRLTEGLLFASGSSRLKPEAFRILGTLGDILNNHAGEEVVIEGHTDDQPLKRTKEKFRTNMNLGAERAMAVFNYLLENGILPESRMVVTSYSANRPVDPSIKSTNSGRAQNRRVVVRLGRRLANI